MQADQLHRPVGLVVEDDANLRELATALLEETDLAIVEVSSAEQALDYLKQHGREVAFLFADIRLPGSMSGIDLARRAKQSWPWVRAVLTSGVPLDDKSDLPSDVTFMPKPWRALEVLIEAERATLASP